MKPEPDAIAVDLICRLTKEFGSILWSYNKLECTSTCRNCHAVKKIGEDSIHREGCKGIAIIIEALTYLSGKDTVPIELISNISSGYYYALADLKRNGVLVGEELFDKIRVLQAWLEKYVNT